MPGRTEKINELGLLGGDKYLGWHYVLLVGSSKQLPTQNSDGHQSEVHSWQ